MIARHQRARLAGRRPCTPLGKQAARMLAALTSASPRGDAQ